VISIEDHNAGDGIRVQSANGNLWFETGFGFGDYHGGVKPAAVAIPPSTDPHPAPNQIQNLIDKFSGASPSYNPSGIRDFSDNGFADSDFQANLDRAMVVESEAKDRYDLSFRLENAIRNRSAIPGKKRGGDSSLAAGQHVEGLPYDGFEGSYLDSAEAEMDLITDDTALKKEAYDNAVRDTANKKAETISNSTLTDIIDTDRVHLRVSAMDTITTQEGNIYDFGGYWNYNLGNSYAEDDVNQTAVLNRKDPHDMLNIGGPKWVSVNWPKPTGAKSGGPTIDLKGTHWTKNQDDYPTGGQVWVQKKWGHDYEYHVGDSISVSEGNTLNVVYGGDHTEAKYSGTTGNIYSWTKGGDAKSWSKDGTLVSESKRAAAASGVTTDEKKYDYNTGDLCSHSMSAGSGMGMAKFDFDYSNTVSMAINTGTITSSEIFLGNKMTNDNFVGQSMSLSTFIGGKIDMAFSLAAILEVRNSAVKVDFPGTSIDTQTNVIDTVANDLKTLALGINNIACKINSATTDIQAIASVHLTA
jgi:hypothetical protein